MRFVNKLAFLFLKHLSFKKSAHVALPIITLKIKLIIQLMVIIAITYRFPVSYLYNMSVLHFIKVLYSIYYLLTLKNGGHFDNPYFRQSQHCE